MKTGSRIVGIVLTILMIIMLVPAFSFETELSFSFTDVPESEWYYGDVQKACESGLMKGFKDNTFRPEEYMTYAQVVKLASCLNQLYEEGTVTLKESSRDWYDDYAEYARENHIITRDYPWNAPAVRGEFCEILTNTLMDSIMCPKNTIEDGTIPDVPVEHGNAEAIYKLYRAGIVAGNDPSGMFFPEGNIQRCEVAAVLTRIIDETVRKEQTRVFSRQPEEIVTRAAGLREGVKIPVLMYHGVSNRVWGLDYLFVSPESMRTQLQWLKDNGYQTIFFSDLVHLSDYKKPVLLTFDDGYDGIYSNLFPLLKEFNMKATIFVVSDEIGTEYRLTKFQLREMSDSGLVSVQSHTKSHLCLDTLDEQQLVKECQGSKEAIGSITGKYPYVISYPEGRHNALSDSVVSGYYTFGVLDRNGSWITNRHTRYQISRTTIPREYSMEQFVEALNR